MKLNLNKKTLSRILIVTLYSLFVLYLFALVKDYSFKANRWVLIPVFILFFNVGSEGNLLIDKFFNKKLPWFFYAKKRLVYQISVTIFWTILITAIPLILRFFVADAPTGFPILAFFTFILAAIFLAAFNGIYIAINFFNNWKSSLLEIEKLKQEKMRSDYKLLQDQINPHFLFNSFNVLISEINYNPETAISFTRKLSQVYRYVLQSKNHDLISLKDELEFIKSYIYLHQVRVGSSLVYNFNIDENDLELNVPPLTLQILVENAIKHNIINTENKLHIAIESEGNKNLLIKNNLSPKKAIESTQTGLSNIISRYALIGDKKITIQNTGNEFIVKIPLLEL